MSYSKYLSELGSCPATVEAIAPIVSAGVVQEEFRSRLLRSIVASEADSDVVDEDVDFEKFCSEYKTALEDVINISSSKVRMFIKLLEKSGLAEMVPGLVSRARFRLEKVLHGVIPVEHRQYLSLKGEKLPYGFFCPEVPSVVISTDLLTNDAVYVHEYLHCTSGIMIFGSYSVPVVSFCEEPDSEFNPYGKGLVNLGEAVTEFLTLWLTGLNDDKNLVLDFANQDILSNSVENVSSYAGLVNALMLLAKVYNLQNKNGLALSIEKLLIDWYFADNNRKQFKDCKEAWNTVFGKGFFYKFLAYFKGCYIVNGSKAQTKKCKDKLAKLSDALILCISQENVNPLMDLIELKSKSSR